jgi:uncharacterized membrane protein
MSSDQVHSMAQKERELVFYGVIVLIVAGHALSVLLDLAAIQVVLGLALIGYIPGALLIRLLFHKSKKLTAFENIVLSVVFSLVLCAGLGLLLNMLPGGLSPTTINLALWGGVALLLALNLGFHRGRAESSAATERHPVSLLEQFKARLSKAELVAYSAILVIALLCVALLAYLLLRVESGEYFTEFYALGPEGLADSYPREAVAGEAVSVTTGITNREGVPADYRIEVRVGDQQIGAGGPIALADGETWEGPVGFALTQPGADQKVEFLLYKAGEAEPYRALHLWLTVTAD